MSEWLTLPVALAQRLVPVRSSRPWFAPAAVRFLDDAVRPSDTVLELGGGSSSAWFAARSRSVITIEPDPAWADQIEASAAAFENLTVVRSTVRAALAGPLEPDIVIIDHRVEPGEMTRPEALRWAVGKAKPPRLVVLDDSDRPDYADEARRLAHAAKVFRGFRSHGLYLTETTIFDLSDRTPNFSSRPPGLAGR